MAEELNSPQERMNVVNNFDEFSTLINKAYQEEWEDITVSHGNKFFSTEVENPHLISLGRWETAFSITAPILIELIKLPKLKHLCLKTNQLGNLPAEIGELTSLLSLDLSNNKLTSLPVEIRKLVNLTLLDISNNQFSHLPIEITELVNLKILNAASNQIETIHPDICKFTKLSSLNLFSNKITSFPVEICKLNNLRFLNLTDNNIVDIPSAIGKLTNLKFLYCSKNNIEQIPREIGLLVNLDHLFLGSISAVRELLENGMSRGAWLIDFEMPSSGGGNKLISLPKEISFLTDLKMLDITGNFLPIPPEIQRKIQEPQAIINYYLSVLEGNKKSINETKLIIVGQGSVGKTSIVNRVINNSFFQNQIKTEGISIETWYVNDRSQTTKRQNQIKLNLWDFGGQEIMHATHQFFLTKRSLYLLVLDSRLTQEENRVEYWLKIIQSFGGESPVLIVGNKIDQHPLDIDRTGLQKKYPNIVGILETSAATGAGIEELKAAITEQVNNLPHVRDLLPETWFTVKTKLEELGKQSNFITQEKYLDLCAENEVTDETSQRTLIGFLHDLGVVLHFQDDPRLEALGILNPQWVTNGVYKILNSHTLFQNKGVLTTSMLDEILNLPEYPRGKRLFIVDMMKKFELCYDIESDKTFLVPDLLPKDQPDLNFNGIPAFEYAYPVLPSSVITRFIVRMNQKIDDGFVWRTGVVLKIGENKALVKADIEDRKITIAIDGLEHTRRDALSAIRYQLDEIHNSIKGLSPEKFVPIPGAESQRYEFLLQLEHDGVKMLPVPAKSGSKPIMVDISQLLSGIESEAQRRENVTHVTTVYHVNTGGGDFTGGDKSISADNGGIVVGKDVTGNIISGNNNKIIQDSYNKIKSTDLDPELKQTLNSLTEAITAVAQSFPDEKTAKVMKNFERLMEEVTQPEPDREWYSVSIEGLIKAAENLDKLGTPVISLSRKVLSLLTGGVAK